MIDIKRLHAQVLAKDVFEDQMAYNFSFHKINLKFHIVLSVKFHRYV